MWCWRHVHTVAGLLSSDNVRVALRRGCLFGAGDEGEGLGDDAVVARAGLVLGVVALLPLVLGAAEDHGLEELGAEAGDVDTAPDGGDAGGAVWAVGGGEFGEGYADVALVAE